MNDNTDSSLIKPPYPLIKNENNPLSRDLVFHLSSSDTLNVTNHLATGSGSIKEI